MEQVRPIILLFALLIGVILLVAWLSKGQLNFQMTVISPKKEIQIGEAKLAVEIADTQAERGRGLTRKNSLGENEGMLFVFEAKDNRPGFWMKNMRFGIDILWIDDGKVIQITENLKPPEKGTPDEQIPIYVPNQPIDYVLEVKDDFVERNNIKVGDQFVADFLP